MSLNLRRFSRESKFLQIKMFMQQENTDIVQRSFDNITSMDEAIRAQLRDWG